MVPLLAVSALLACRPAEGFEEKDDAPLGEMRVVVHANSAARQLEVRLERLEPDGCEEEEPGCVWVQKSPLLIDLTPSDVDETWSGKIKKLEVGNYRLEASAVVEGDTFETAAKVPVEVRKGLEPQLHLVLRQHIDVPAHGVPYFSSLLLDVHPVEPEGSVQLTIAGGPSGGNLELRAFSEDPVPQGGSACPPGGCNRGTFAESFPLAFDPSLGLTLTWEAPADPGDFLHPIELELQGRQERQDPNPAPRQSRETLHEAL